MNTEQAIYNEALSLSDMDRAALVHDLISSLGGVQTTSQEEIERRITIIHSGKAVSRPARSVFRNIRNKL